MSRVVRRREKIQRLYNYVIKGVESYEDIFDMANGLVSVECLSCQKSFIHNHTINNCGTKVTQGACLLYEPIKMN